MRIELDLPRDMDPQEAAKIIQETALLLAKEAAYFYGRAKGTSHDYVSRKLELQSDRLLRAADV